MHEQSSSVDHRPAETWRFGVQDADTFHDQMVGCNHLPLEVLEDIISPLCLRDIVKCRLVSGNEFWTEPFIVLL